MSKSFSDQSTPVLWLQVWSLAAVQGAIALMWVIYNLYLVDLLQRAGLSAGLATGLLVLENLLGIGMEPLMGSLSDQVQRQVGTRLPLVTLGVILAAGLFVALPAIAVGQFARVMQWVLPIAIVAWALAMTVFRSPALSLLGRYAFATRLPQAASILTLVGGGAGAMGPLASEVILNLGPGTAFALGSIVLIGAGLLLRLFAAQESRRVEGRADAATLPEAVRVAIVMVPPVPLSARNLALIFGAGAGITFGLRLLLSLFPKALQGQVPNAPVNSVMGCIFLALAIAAIPAGYWAVRLGNRRAMVIGLVGMVLVCGALGAVKQTFWAVALAIFLGIAFSLVANGTIPFALSMVPEFKAGLGTGMYFGGAAAALAVFGAIFGTELRTPVAIGSAIAALSLLLAGGCVMSASRSSHSNL